MKFHWDFDEALTPWWCGSTRQLSAITNTKRPQLTAPLSPSVPLCPLKPIDTKADVTSCAFWEYEPGGLQGHWATGGCRTVHVDANATSCSCNHLTHFAILMSSGRANVSHLMGHCLYYVQDTHTIFTV